jgi:hypothetical protein
MSLGQKAVQFMLSMAPERKRVPSIVRVPLARARLCSRSDALPDEIDHLSGAWGGRRLDQLQTLLALLPGLILCLLRNKYR